MTTNYESQVTVINDLIILNNDRIDGYELASQETDDMGLKKIFDEFARQSRGYVSVLGFEIRKLGGEATTSTSASGKFYRAWMEIKTALTGKSRKSIIASCEYGEDVILEAYETALVTEESITSDLRELLLAQKNELKESHDTVKELRDAPVII